MSRVIRKLAGGYQDDSTTPNGAIQIEGGWAPGALGLGTPGWLYGADELLAVSVHRGRERAGAAFDAGILTFSVPVNGAGERERFQIGDFIYARITMAMWAFLNGDPDGPLPNVNLYRNVFAGTISDARLSYRRRHAGQPPQAVADVTVVGPKARAGQARIGDTPWGAEPLRDRLAAIEAAGNAAAFPGWPPPLPMRGAFQLPDYYGDVIVNARDVDRQPPLALYESLAADIGGDVWESLSAPGVIKVTALEYRANRTPLVQLTAGEVAATATWSQSLAGLCNRLDVEYGQPDDRRTVSASDDVSVSAYGEYSASRSTEIAGYWGSVGGYKPGDPGPAQRLASLTVARNSRPAWSISRLDVDLLDLALPRAKAKELLRADVGDLVELVGLPSTAPGGRFYFIEGTELNIDASNVQLTVFVSEAGRTAAPLTWDQLDPTTTWNGVDPAMTWLGAATWFEPPPDGPARWVDVAGDVTWSDLAAGADRTDSDPAAPTWDSYPAAP